MCGPLVSSYGRLLPSPQHPMLKVCGRPFINLHVHAVDDAGLYSYLQSGARLTRPSSCPEPVFAIALACFLQSPEDRPVRIGSCFRLFLTLQTFVELSETTSKQLSRPSNYEHVGPIVPLAVNPLYEEQGLRSVADIQRRKSAFNTADKSLTYDSLQRGGNSHSAPIRVKSNEYRDVAGGDTYNTLHQNTGTFSSPSDYDKLGSASTNYNHLRSRPASGSIGVSVPSSYSQLTSDRSLFAGTDYDRLNLPEVAPADTAYDHIDNPVHIVAGSSYAQPRYRAWSGDDDDDDA
jgi:hypothetical protein